jgi:hypothetical protein
MRLWRRAIFLLALLGLGPALPYAHAQRAEATEASVKAAFLYKFAGYIDWPENSFAASDAPFVMGVLGADEIAADLTRIVAGRSLGGHPVTVQRMKEGESSKGVHLLFVGKVEPARLAAILRSAQQHGVLAVTENERGLEAGSAINFVVSEDRVGFEVSLDSAEKSGHRISSRMLAVARRVVPRAL